MAQDAVAALDLWTAATAGEFAPEVTVSEDCTGADWCITAVDAISVADCPDPTVPNNAARSGARACSWRTDAGVSHIVLALTTAPEERVSSLAHEAGHRLGLAHLVGTGDLMDPDRPHEARRAPCVSTEDVAGAGFAGPGTCGG